jgi:thymidylate synthase
MEQVQEMLGRDSVECEPYIELNPDKKDFYDFNPEDIRIKEYPYQKIKTINPQLPFPLGI